MPSNNNAAAIHHLKTNNCNGTPIPTVSTHYNDHSFRALRYTNYSTVSNTLLHTIVETLFVTPSSTAWRYYNSIFDSRHGKPCRIRYYGKLDNAFRQAKNRPGIPYPTLNIPYFDAMSGSPYERRKRAGTHIGAGTPGTPREHWNISMYIPGMYCIVYTSIYLNISIFRVIVRNFVLRHATPCSTKPPVRVGIAQQGRITIMNIFIFSSTVE